MVATERCFEPSLATPADARAFVHESLRDVDADVHDAATLLASELVTNAVFHAVTRVLVRVTKEPSMLHVEVDDGDPHPPRRRAGGINGGYGLLLVEALSDAWGCELRDDGKTVWFDVVLHS